jgi:hypothetical protein
MMKFEIDIRRRSKQLICWNTSASGSMRKNHILPLVQKPRRFAGLFAALSIAPASTSRGPLNAGRRGGMGTLNGLPPHIPAADLDLIVREFKNYSRFTTGQLVSLSHETGGPWDTVYQRHLADATQSPRIPNELIRKHFEVDKPGLRH